MIQLNLLNIRREIWRRSLRKLLKFSSLLSQMRCAIWYHLYNLKNVKNTYGGMLFLVKGGTETEFCKALLDMERILNTSMNIT